MADIRARARVLARIDRLVLLFASPVTMFLALAPNLAPKAATPQPNFIVLVLVIVIEGLRRSTQRCLPAIASRPQG